MTSNEPLTGGYWRTTDDGDHIYIKNGVVIAGLGKQAGKGPLSSSKVNQDGSITTPGGATIYPDTIKAVKAIADPAERGRERVELLHKASGGNSEAYISAHPFHTIATNYDEVDGEEHHTAALKGTPFSAHLGGLVFSQNSFDKARLLEAVKTPHNPSNDQDPITVQWMPSIMKNVVVDGHHRVLAAALRGDSKTIRAIQINLPNFKATGPVEAPNPKALHILATT